MPALGSKKLAWFRASALAFAAWVWISAAAASFEFTKPRWDSSTKFLELARSQVGERRVILGAELDWSSLTPADAVLVLHPQQRLDYAQVSEFLAAGGRFALVDDFGKGDQLLSRFHIQRVSAPSSPLETLRDNPRLPLARAALTFARDGSPLRHPMVESIDRVATNHPASLVTASGVELTPVLTIGDSRGEQHLLAVIGVIGDALACGLDDGRPRGSRARCGRLFAMADPSVFINLMLELEDNRQFASALIDYLLEDDAWGPRQGNLHILVNDFVQTGDYGGRGDLQDQVDSALDRLADWLGDARSQGLPERVSWMLALLGGAAIAVAAWRLSGKIYERPSPRYAAHAPLVGQGGWVGRAAVLSQKTTRPLLVVLELQTAAQQYLRERLGLPERSSSKEILSALEQRGVLEPSALTRLKRLFEHMASAERALLGAESARFSSGSIKTLHAELERTLSAVEAHTRNTP